MPNKKSSTTTPPPPPVTVPYFVARASMYSKELPNKNNITNQQQQRGRPTGAAVGGGGVYTSSFVNTTWNSIPGVGPLLEPPTNNNNTPSPSTTSTSSDVDPEQGKGSQLVVSSPGMGLEMCYAELIVQLHEEQQQLQQQQCRQHNSTPTTINNTPQQQQQHAPIYQNGHTAVTIPLLNVLLIPDQLLGGTSSDNGGDSYLERLGLCIEIAANDVLLKRAMLKGKGNKKDMGVSDNHDISSVVVVDVRCALSGMLPVQRSQLYKPATATSTSTTTSQEPSSSTAATKASKSSSTTPSSKGTPHSRFLDILVTSSAPKRPSTTGTKSTPTTKKQQQSSTTSTTTPTAFPTTLSVVILPVSYFIADVLHKRISLELICTSIVIWIPQDLRNISGIWILRMESLLASMAFVLQLGTEAQTERKRIIEYYTANNSTSSLLSSSSSSHTSASIESSIPASIRASLPPTGGGGGQSSPPGRVLGRTLPHLTVMSDSPSSIAALFGVRNTLQLPNSNTNISPSSTSTKKVVDASASYPRLKRLQELFNISALNLFPWFRFDILQIRKATEAASSSSLSPLPTVAATSTTTAPSTWSVEELYVKCSEEERYVRQELLAILADLLVEAKGSLRRVEMEDERMRIEEETLREEQRLAMLLGSGDQSSSSIDNTSTRPNGAQIRRSAEEYVSRRYRSLFSGVSLADVSLDDLVHAQRTGLQWRLREFVASVSRNSVATSIEVNLLSQKLAHSRGSTFADAVQIADDDSENNVVAEENNRRQRGGPDEQYRGGGGGVETIYQRLRTCAQSIAALLDVCYLYKSAVTSASRSRYGAGNVCFQLEDMVSGYHAEYTRAVLGIVMPSSGGGRYQNTNNNNSRRGAHVVKAFTGISAGAGADLAQFSAAIWTTSTRFTTLRERLWDLLASSVVKKSISENHHHHADDSSPLIISTSSSSSMSPPLPKIKRTLTLRPTLSIDSRFTLIGEFMRNWIHTMVRRWNAWIHKKGSRSSSSSSSSRIVCPSALLVVPDEYTLRRVKEYLQQSTGGGHHSDGGTPHQGGGSSDARGGVCPRNCIYHPPDDSGAADEWCPTSVMACMEFCRCLVRLVSRADTQRATILPTNQRGLSSTPSSITSTMQKKKVTMLSRPTPTSTVPTTSSSTTTTLLTRKSDIGEKRPRDDDDGVITTNSNDGGDDGFNADDVESSSSMGGGNMQLPPTFGDVPSPNIASLALFTSTGSRSNTTTHVAETDEYNNTGAAEDFEDDEDVELGGGVGGDLVSEEGGGSSQIAVLRGIIDLVTCSQLQEEGRASGRSLMPESDVVDGNKECTIGDHMTAPTTTTSASSPLSPSSAPTVPTSEESLRSKQSDDAVNLVASTVHKKSEAVRTLWAKASEFLRADTTPSKRGVGDSEKSSSTRSATVQSTRSALLYLHQSVLQEIYKRPTMWFGSSGGGRGGIARELEEATRGNGGNSGGVGGYTSLNVYEDAVANLFCRVLFPCVQLDVVTSSSSSSSSSPSINYSVIAQSSSTVVLQARTTPGISIIPPSTTSTTTTIDPPQILLAVTTAESLTVSHLARMLQSKLVTVKTTPALSDRTSSSSSAPPPISRQEVIALDDSSTDDEKPSNTTASLRIHDVEMNGDIKNVTVEVEQSSSSSTAAATPSSTPIIDPTTSFCGSTVRRIIIFEPNILLARKIETAKGVAIAAAANEQYQQQRDHTNGTTNSKSTNNNNGSGGASLPSSSSSMLHDPLSRGITKVVLLKDSSELSPRRPDGSHTAVDVEDDDNLVDVDVQHEATTSTTTNTTVVVSTQIRQEYPRIAVQSSTVDQSIDLTAFEVLMKAKRDMPSAIMVSLAARRALLNLLKGGGSAAAPSRTNQPVNTQRRLLTAAVQGANSALSSSTAIVPTSTVATSTSSTSSSALVVVDDREFRATLPFFLFLAGVRLTPLTLLEGDYVLSAHCALERKSFADFNQSIQKGRLQEQLVRMSRKYAYPVILIEDSNFPSCIGSGGGKNGDLSTITSSSGHHQNSNNQRGSGGSDRRSRDEIVASTITALMNGTLPYIAGSGGGDNDDNGGGSGDLGVGRLQQVYRFRQTHSNGGSSGGGSVAPFVMTQLYKRIVGLMAALPSVIWMWSRSPEHSAQMIAHLKTGGGHGDLTTTSSSASSGHHNQHHAPQLLSHSIGTSNPDIGSAALTVKASESEADATRAAVRMIVRFPGVNRRNVIKLMSAARSLAGLASMSKEQLIDALDDNDEEVSDNNTGWGGGRSNTTHRYSNGVRLYHFLHTSLHTE